MNVLILTPDSVGSTLLQRLVTIYMQFHAYDKPVINLHELTNGLAKYYSNDFNQEIVSKKALAGWGYFQSLAQIVEMLDSVDHYKTSRLAHYHIKIRGDTLEQQVPFYQYLNENFFIVACRRENVFEHALSRALSHTTKKLNIYSHDEKLSMSMQLYQHGINLDIASFLRILDEYRDYINWSENFFSVSSYFSYERDLPNIEKFILNLPIFQTQIKKFTWHEKFDIDFSDWNRCHYLTSDIKSIVNNQTAPMISHHTGFNSDFQTREHAIAQIRDHGLSAYQDSTTKEYLEKHTRNYQISNTALDKMIELGIMISRPPIKKHTLSEKQSVILNFDQCLDIYNQWIMDNPKIGTPLDDNCLEEKKQHEESFWSPVRDSTSVISDQRSIGWSVDQNDVRHGLNPVS